MYSPGRGFYMGINISLVLLGFIGVLALVGALKGLSRGISRQTVRTLTVIAAAVISFILAKSCYTLMSDFFEGKTTEDVLIFLTDNGILSAGQDLSLIKNVDLKIIELLLALPMAVIIMPFVFVICFILTSALLLIVHWILSAIFGFKKRRNNAVTRLLGMALGLIQGVVVAALILMPVVGIGNSVSESVAILKEETSGEQSTADIIELYDTYVKEIVEDPVVTVIGKCGGNLLYRGIATVEIDGKDCDMTKLLPDVTLIVSKGIKIGSADFTNLTPENEQTINELLDVLEGSQYLSEIVAGAVRSVANACSNGAVELPLEPPFDTFVDSAISIFTTTDTTNLHTDLDTISEVLFILSRDGVFSAFDSGSDALLDIFTKCDANGDTTIKRIVNTINKNERIKPLVNLITKLSVSVMADQIGMDENTADAYENIKTGINEKVMKINKADYATEDEYVDALSDSLHETLNENNVQLEKGIVDNMAQFIADNYSDKTEIADDEIDEVILSYYDAYIDYMEENSETQQ